MFWFKVSWKLLLSFRRLIYVCLSVYVYVSVCAGGNERGPSQVYLPENFMTFGTKLKKDSFELQSIFSSSSGFYSTYTCMYRLSVRASDVRCAFSRGFIIA